MNEGDDLSHEAYLAWLQKNGLNDAEYSVAHHAEKAMTLAGGMSFIRTQRSLAEMHDTLLLKFGPLLAAEAMRRALSTLAESGETLPSGSR